MYHTRGVREDSKYNHTHRVDADVSRDLLQYQQSAMVGKNGIMFPCTTWAGVFNLESRLVISLVVLNGEWRSAIG